MVRVQWSPEGTGFEHWHHKLLILARAPRMGPIPGGIGLGIISPSSKFAENAVSGDCWSEYP